MATGDELYAEKQRYETLYINIIIQRNGKQNNNQGQFQVDLPADVSQGQYANFAIITHSSSDFVLDFARILPGVPKATVKSRVILAPEHAKRLLMALQDNIVRYENAFGQIKIPQQEKGTIAPFHINKGEA
ncbi:DUF3467 domain-containing protein [Xylanibacter rarus]|uniref:DUF3467 domain-containing protein n=1 Tax=Xylanibacter rarus TaxID=1676614 RepID=UPI0009E9182B|nr:DUF3467 domain-containing protein [Xylanibacter rarus]